MDRRNFLFMGFSIPDDEMEQVFKKDELPAIQTHKFNWNLIKGLESSNKFCYTYVATRPITDYPLYPKKIIRKNYWKVNLKDKKIQIMEIPFINTSILKIITRFISSSYYSFKQYHSINNKGGVIVYSVHVPFMLTGYLISKIYNIDYVAVWTDPPAVTTEKESFIKSKFRKIELKISKFLMNKATKAIVLTKYLAEDFAPQKPYVVIEGIIDEQEIDINKCKKEYNKNNLIKVVYTGSLNKKYGIKNIVEGFLLNDDDNIVLDIYGYGDYEEELIKICSKNMKIRYRGFKPNNEILKIQREADFLINARSSEDEYTRYSFPSKTLEYMMSGTPLITTMLPGMPEYYRDYIIVLENNLPITICKKLKQIKCLSEEERYNIGIEALHFVKSKNYKKQGEKITDFLME